jgi:hypothetical protein
VLEPKVLAAAALHKASVVKDNSDCVLLTTVKEFEEVLN